MKTAIEYVWIGGNYEFRSKTRVLEMKKNDKGEFVINIPQWTIDGSATNQASLKESEIVLIPRSIFKCPFRRGDNIMVICDAYKSDGTPAKNNFRAQSELVFKEDTRNTPTLFRNGARTLSFLAKRTDCKRYDRK